MPAVDIVESIEIRLSVNALPLIYSQVRKFLTILNWFFMNYYFLTRSRSIFKQGFG